VHGSEAFEGGRRQRLDLGFLADVGAHHVRLDTVAAHLVGGCGQRLLLDVGQHDVQAGAGQAFGQRQPDPARRARDDGDLSPLQFHVRNIIRRR